MKKRILIVLNIVGGIALVFLLAGAAFIGGGLLNGQSLQLPNGQVFNSGSGGHAVTSCDISRVPAKELPGPPIMRRGDLVKRENNSIFVGVPLRNVAINPGGTISQTTGFDGPVVEVVVAHDTKLYRDVTFQNYHGQVCGQVQEVLAPGTLDDIVADTTFLVWGERVGDRVIASHLVYELPLGAKPGVGK
jgi:hypothetical protein